VSAKSLDKEVPFKDIKLRLTKEGSKSAYFKVVPHKSKTIGDKVLIRDQIRFIHVKTEAGIHQCPEFIDENYSYEVNLDKYTPTAWTVIPPDIGLTKRTPLRVSKTRFFLFLVFC
jgi:hypothetical protein